MEHPVFASFRRTLTSTRNGQQLADEVVARIHQLISGMVDGRVLPPAEAEALRAGIYEFVRTEALPTLAKRDPNYALLLLNKVAALEPWTKINLAEELPALAAAQLSKYPPPRPVSWPVLERLRNLAADAPNLCSLHPHVKSSAFVKTLRDAGGKLPDEIIGLYGTFDGIELSSASDPVGQSWKESVFTFLESEALGMADAGDGWPRRVEVFRGGAGVRLCVYSDRNKAWWCSYECDYEPVAKLPLEVPALLDFAIQRALATDPEMLIAQLSWERYFKTP